MRSQTHSNSKKSSRFAASVTKWMASFQIGNILCAYVYLGMVMCPIITPIDQIRVVLQVRNKSSKQCKYMTLQNIIALPPFPHLRLGVMQH